MQDEGASETDVSNVIAGVVMGAAAGAIAVWVMDRVDWFAYNHESDEARQQTIAARPDGMDPAHVLAEKMGAMAGKENRQPHPAGLAVHYSLGIGPGAIYGALHETVPALSAGRGSLFGLALFLLQDEGLNTVTKLAGQPSQYPWQAHARGLVAHVVYGLVMDSTVRALKKLVR